MKKKVEIDYLQFLSELMYDDKVRTWFVTYLDPKTDKVKRVEAGKVKLRKIHKELIKKLTKAKKNFKPKVDIKKAKKIKLKWKSEKQKHKTAFSKFVTKKILTHALEMKVDGHDKDKIALELMRLYNLAFTTATYAVDWCYAELCKSVDENDINAIILFHGRHYDELWKRFIELKVPRMAMLALRNKETLNGIGNDIFDIQINNVLLEGQQGVENYDIKKLSNSEQQEFLEILNKISNKNAVKQLEASRRLPSDR